MRTPERGEALFEVGKKRNMEPTGEVKAASP
jgi:hypothetical protein